MDGNQPIIIVGAGAAGIMAARRATELGRRVRLMERNGRPGIKILISGGGKCNITHEGTPEELLAGFPRREARFLKHAFFSLTNRDVISLLERQGLATMTRSDGRVFPANGSAREVVAALLAPLPEGLFSLECRTRASSLIAEGGHITGVRVGESVVHAPAVIVATGGASYPQTGTTGDGYRWLAGLGHTIVEPRAALAPIQVDPPHPPEWRGIALRDGVLDLLSGGKRIARWRGDILFSHEGISGPAALEVSREAALVIEKGSARLAYDLLPDVDDPDRLLTERIRSASGRTIATIMESFIPARTVQWALQSSGVEPRQKGYNLRKEERKALVLLLKAFPLGTVVKVDRARGEVTSGGVSLSEVSPKTMESRIIRGLYICGELLDVAGRVGGYNLQAAFSTGFVAGEAAARVAGNNAD